MKKGANDGVQKKGILKFIWGSRDRVGALKGLSINLLKNNKLAEYLLSTKAAYFKLFYPWNPYFF